MRKIIILVFALAAIAVVLALGDKPTGATSALKQSFDSRYGPELSNKFGCGVCHGTGSLSELNPYGQDLVDAMIDAGGCLDFYPPNTHTIPKGRCEYLHADGLFTPYSSRCTLCHGADLQGLIAPSCYLCHGERWTETSASATGNGSGPHPPTVDDALAAIENLDSDGDGHSNIAEIEALSNPGDPASFPGGEVKVDVKMDQRWQREWVTEAGFLTVTVKPKAGGTIEGTKFVALKTDAGELYSTRLKMRGTNVEALFPKALLYRLFGSLDDKNAKLLVRGETMAGSTFSARYQVRLEGRAPDLAEGISLKSDPKTWEKDSDVTLTIRDSKQININRPVSVVGLYRKTTLEDVRRSGKTVTGKLDADDAQALLGRQVMGVVYTIGVYGSTNTPGENFAAAVEVPSSATECYDFDPPPSHTIPLIRGDCTYMHASGYKTPYESQCNACHGAKLRGTSVTPSCYLCHGQLWTESVVGYSGSTMEKN